MHQSEGNDQPDADHQTELGIVWHGFPSRTGTHSATLAGDDPSSQVFLLEAGAAA
jgi:hypothetical protein